MDRKLTFAFYGRDVSAGRTMHGIAGQTEGLRSKSLAAAKAVGVLAGGAAIAGLTSALRTGFGEVKDYQTGLAQLKAGLKSTGNQAGVTVKGMERLASKIEGYSGQTDDSIVKTEQLLLTFTKIRNEAGKGNKIFDQTTKIAADMAARMGGDASGAAIQLGKALNDPVKGMTALTRVGVSFTEMQVAQNKALVEGGIANALAATGHETTASTWSRLLEENQGDVNATIRQITGPLSAAQKKMFDHFMEGGHAIEAQKNILHELNTEFGGSARQYGKTLPGQLDRLKRAYEGITQELATAVLPYAMDFTKWLRKDALPALEDFGGWVKNHKKQLEWFAGILGGAAVSLKAFRAVRGVQALVGRGPLAAGGGLTGSLRPIPVYVVNGPTGKAPIGGPAGAAGRATGFWGGAAGLAAGALGLVNILKNQSNLPGDTSIRDRALNAAGSGAVFGTTTDRFGTDHVLPSGPADPAFNKAQGAEHAQGLLGIKFVQGSKAASDAAKKEAQDLQNLNQLLIVQPGLAKAAGLAHGELANGMRSVVAEAKIEAALLGHDLGRGLIAGIEAEVPHATVAGKILVQQTVKSMRLAADAHSPSRETGKLGKDLADGLFVGFTNVRVWDKLEADMRHGLRRLSNTAQNARDYRSNLRFGLLGSLSLSGMQGATDSFGSPTGSGSVHAYIRQKVHRLRQFKHLRAQLENHGASPALLAEFDELGPDAIPQMREELSTGRKGIRRDSRLLREGRRIAGSTASAATEDRFGGKLEHLLQRLPDRIAHSLVRELRRELHIDLNLREHDHKQRKKVRQHG